MIGIAPGGQKLLRLPGILSEEDHRQDHCTRLGVEIRCPQSHCTVTLLSVIGRNTIGAQSMSRTLPWYQKSSGAVCESEERLFPRLVELG